jgi:hypothetical protein
VDSLPSTADQSADRLPAILTRASNRLMEARDSAEMMEAKQTAEAALHFAKLTKAANETHADCLRIITRAEMRMADEIDQGQATGRISKRGRATNKKARAPDLYKELGVSKQRVAEWREVREAGSKKIDTILESVLAEGRAPTKNDILKGIRPEKAGTKAKTRKPRAMPAVQPSLAKFVSEPDFQIDAAAGARNLEIERDEGIAPAVAADPQEKPSTGAIGPEKGAEPETEAETKSVDPNGARLLDVLHDFEQNYVKRDPIVLLAIVSGELQDEVRRVASVVAGWLNRLCESAGFDDTIEPAAGVGQLVGNEKETGAADCSPDGKQVGIANTTAVCPALAARDPWEAVGPIPEHLRDGRQYTADMPAEDLVRPTPAAPIRTSSEHGSETSDGTQSDSEVEDLFETRSGS